MTVRGAIPRLLALCFAAAFSALIGRASAQDAAAAPATDPAELSLEELVNVRVDSVFAASKYEQKVTEAPASVSIVTADEIRKFGYRSLADILRSIRGYYVSYDRSYSSLGSRGFLRPGDFNTRYLLLVDGHRMNDNIFGEGAESTDIILDVDLIERVEIIRGPSSSIYGNSAFLGVISVILKTGSQPGGTEGSVEAGSLGTYKGRVSFGKQFANSVTWLLSGSYSTSNGQARLYFPEFDQRVSGEPRGRNDGIVRDSDGELIHQLFTSLSYDDFTLTGAYGSRMKHIPTAPFGSFFGAGHAETADRRGFLDLAYDHAFDEDTEISGRVSYDAFPHLGKYPYDYGTSNQPRDIAIDYDGARGSWLTTEAQVKQRLFDRHTIVLGVDYRQDLQQHLYNFDSNHSTFIEDRRTGRSFGTFGQAELVIRPNLLLNAGLRYDHYDTFGGSLNPRIGVIYTPWPATTFKFLYGRAFRAPSDYELFYGSASFGQVPNPGLAPEKIQTYELVYEQYLPSHLRFGVSGYYYRIDDLIAQTTQAGTGLLVFENIDHIHTKGVELELERKYPGGALVRASYAFQRTADATTGADLPDSPRHLAKLNLVLPVIGEKLSVGSELQYTSSVKALDRDEVAGFTIANATLSCQNLVPHLEVSASVYNVFNRSYAYPGSIGLIQETVPQIGRTWRLKLTYKF